MRQLNILCLISPFPSHLDFGGMGFLKLARNLSQKGHSLTCIAPPIHKSALTNSGLETYIDEDLGSLALLPHCVDRTDAQRITLYQKLLQTLGRLGQFIERHRIDVLLCDRVLFFAKLLTGRYYTPVISVGTPGGNWHLEGKHMALANRNPHPFTRLGDRVAGELGWPACNNNSVWINSEFGNITFMNNNFYDAALFELSKLISVHHFSDSPASRHRQKRLGFSFGNSGPVEILIEALSCFTGVDNPEFELDVFIGHRTKLKNTLEARFGSKINVHGWVNFDDVFPQLSGMVFFGGVGTIWYCIEHEVPMLAVPVGGDQAVNANSVKKLQLGEYLDFENMNRAGIEATIARFLREEHYSENIRRYKSPENFTDTMDSVGERLAALTQ